MKKGAESIQSIPVRLFRELLKGLRYAPRRIVTNKLGSYGAARKEVLPNVIHDQGKRKNNRAEVSYQPTRQRARQMRRFKSPRQVQRFLSAHSPINNLFRCGRHLTRAAHYRLFRERAFDLWREVTCVQHSYSVRMVPSPSSYVCRYIQ